ncbi:MAG: hypothetical protein HOW73_03080 [Polyangiaceae bacterium]|nr:hypothetical protein [Polyangiaceae bacterium]
MSNANEEGRASAPDAHEANGPPSMSHTTGAATLWLTEDAWALSIWRGEVDAPDRLRVDARDGSVHELRLERSVGASRPVRLGRAPSVGAEVNDLVFPDVASRLAALFRYDGTRWWIQRREECSVPVEVGPRALGKLEEAPLVHGTCIVVGGMRAIFADRRYVTFSVPAGAVDPATGLLGRTGLELEIAIALRRKTKAFLVVARDESSTSLGGPPSSRHVPSSRTPKSESKDYSPLARFALAAHRAKSSLPIAIVDGTVFLLVSNESDASAIEAVAPADVVLGLWPLRGASAEGAGRELELAMAAIAMRAHSHATSHANAEGSTRVGFLREEGQVEIATPEAVIEAARSEKRALLLLGIEEQHALDRVGRHVLPGLEEELAAVAKAQGGAGVTVAPLARGVIGAAVPRKQDPSALASAIQCDWHARSPIVDGRAELPRSLSWEVHAVSPGAGPSAPVDRAVALSRECADPSGVLSSLGGGLPYPIAGRVALLSSARSGVERVKMLFDVLEGTWRFMAAVVCAAFLSVPGDGHRQANGAVQEFIKRNATRDGYALGTWRELARHAVSGLEGRTDPIATMAREVLGVRLAENQTFDTLSNLLQAERNSFAHGQYTEASAAADLLEFEQMTRTLLRALRPLSVWTLVTVEATEPDMYGEQQTVEYIDHTGPSVSGVRRRIGFMSSIRLANVTYLARWREGLVLPLEPFLRRLPIGDRFELYWMDHLPRPGNCAMSAVVGGQTIKSACDARRLPPLLRKLVGA